MQTMVVKENKLQNQKGSASLEAALLIPIFVILMTFVLGGFGIVHTAILHNISARTYAIETFDNRSDVTYFRANRGAGNSTEHYFNIGYRIHGIGNIDIIPNQPRWFPSARAMSIGLTQNRNIAGRSQVDDLNTGRRYTGQGVNPVWIKVTYGLCINNNCGGL